MMRFRRIYWVTEQLDEAGKSEVTGVYTSIPDLVETGIKMKDYCAKRHGFRITLWALDTDSPPLLEICSPDFRDVEEKLKPFVQTGEITSEEAATLSEALQKLIL